MLFLIFKICLQQLFPESQDLSGLFDVEVTPRRQRQQRRQQRARISSSNGSRPQSVNHRRIGRDYDRDYYQARVRRIRQQQREELGDDIAMTELQVMPSPVQILRQRMQQQAHHSINANDNQVMPEESSERLATQGNDHLSIIDEQVLRMHHNHNHGSRHRDQRMRRDFIRNEILRILTSSDFERTRGSHNSFLLRNLQYLQMSTLGRDFNENDYEMLSSLDSQNYRRMTSTKAHLLISQLPTYQFKSKKGSNTAGKCDYDDLEDKNCDGEEKSSFSDNQYSKDTTLDQSYKSADKAQNQDFNNKDTCTICIESFADDETIKILPCFHQFHSQCIDDWLLRKTNCPVCKFDIKQAAQNERQLSQQFEQEV